VITYTYDPLNRLTGAAYSDDTFFAYQYDAVGNREALTTTTGVVHLARPPARCPPL
jgi:YD repeat-containing protein